MCFTSGCLKLKKAAALFAALSTHTSPDSSAACRSSSREVVERKTRGRSKWLFGPGGFSCGPTRAEPIARRRRLTSMMLL